jgi:hypothetical protein
MTLALPAAKNTVAQRTSLVTNQGGHIEGHYKGTPLIG